MVKKRIFSALTAIALSFAAVPVFTTTVENQQIPLVASAADEYTVPDVNIASMGIPDLDSFKFVSDMTLGFKLGLRNEEQRSWFCILNNTDFFHVLNQRFNIK